MASAIVLPITTIMDSAEVVAAITTAKTEITALQAAEFYTLNIPSVALNGTATFYTVAPLAGTITKIYSVIDGALTTGDATLTAKINTTAITTGVITITQSASAAGDVDVATPTALNTVVAGDYIAVTVGGSNAAAKTAHVTVAIRQS